MTWGMRLPQPKSLSYNLHFKLASATHSYNTRSVRNGILSISSYNSVRFRRKSIIANNNIRSVISEIKATDVKSLKK